MREEAPTGAVHVVVGLAEDAEMPAVRAFMVLGEVAEHGTLERSEPDAEAIDGFAGRTIEVWVRTDDPDALLAASARCPTSPSARSSSPRRRASMRRPATHRPRGEAFGGVAVRVPAARLDDLLHAMGELVVQRTHVEALVAQSGVPGLGQAMAELTRSTHALQELVMGVRMIPVEAVLLRLPRLVRDLARAWARRSSSSSSARRPSWTGPSSTRSATRSCTSSATPSTTASSRRRSASPRASRRAGASRSPRARPEAAS